MSTSLGRIRFNVGSLCTGLICALLSLAWSRPNHTLPLVLFINAKQLYHSNVSSMPRGTIICCFCSLSRSSLTGSWIAYATCLGVGMAGCHS